jgi:hypothetical protein
MQTPSAAKSFYILIIFLSFLFAPNSFATQQLSNPVTRYNITLDPSQDGRFLGWIELINGAGYVLRKPAIATAPECAKDLYRHVISDIVL